MPEFSAIKPTDFSELTAGHIHFQKTTATVRLKTRTWGPPLPKMKKQKRRRGNTIVLKPPPEDWPEPKMPGGATLSERPDIGETIPPMGTHIDTKLGRKAFNPVLGSPPYMGHRKIDFAPQDDKTTVNDQEVSVTRSSLKWRIRGRRDREGGVPWPQRGGGYMNEFVQEPGFKKFYIPENTTYLIPTVRNTRAFQRSYFNFRMRPPMNIGRSFGPPGHPFPQPPPPPRFVPNHPYGQPPYPQFPQGPPYPRPPPPPPYGSPQFGPLHPRYGQGPPPFPPFGQGLSPHFRRPPIPPLPPQYGPFPTPIPPQPRGPPDLFPDGPPPAPPSPYPTGPNLPPVRPFLEDIPTISPIDDVPAPWPRRQINREYRAPHPRVPEFLRHEPKNFSGYKGPRRGQGYEQYGKVDLRPRHVKLYDHFAKITPRLHARKGSGFGAHFQEDITRPSYVPGEMFVRRTWPTRPNRFGYEPYRRTSDRRRPYGYSRYAAERPPVLGDFGDYKPYKRLDDSKYMPYNFSRPTRSYTFPPRLRIAIRNATYQRRAFHRSGYRGYTLPTLPSIGLEAFLAHDLDFYGNPITPKGRIFNLHDLKKLFTNAPEVTDVSAEMDSATTPISVLLSAVFKVQLTAKPKGMTAREAMRAAAREAIKEAELEAWEAGENVGRRGMRRGMRSLGGSGGRGGKVIRRGGARGSGRSPMNFRRVKRSVDEEAAWAEKRRLFKQKIYGGEDYLTGPGAGSSSSSSTRHESRSQVPLRMRRWHLWRRKGRPL